MEALKMSEARLMTQMQNKLQDMFQGQVKELVDAQLHAAGFDQDLSAGDLTVRRLAMSGSVRVRDEQAPSMTYAGAAASPSATLLGRPVLQEAGSISLSKEERRENKFQVARRSLRLWPISGGKKESLETFLVDKLRFDRTFLEEELGQVIMTKPKEPRNKNKDEYIVTFESKQIRDTIKANAPNLANHRDAAGMRLQVPDHLQRDFQALMNLSFDLKKRHPTLKRNIKFDEEDQGLFMDIKLAENGEWKKVKPLQALAAVKNRRKRTSRSLDEGELKELLGEEGESE